MGNAVWLLLVLPEWYFSSVFDPFSAGVLTVVPACGVVCLAIGLLLLFRFRSQRLWLYVVPFMLSQGLVSISGLFRGQVSSPNLILLSFLAVQVAVSATIAVISKGARAPALAFSVFSITYALFAAFVATMSFTDNWLSIRRSIEQQLIDLVPPRTLIRAGNRL